MPQNSSVLGVELYLAGCNFTLNRKTNKQTNICINSIIFIRDCMHPPQHSSLAVGTNWLMCHRSVSHCLPFTPTGCGIKTFGVPSLSCSTTHKTTSTGQRTFTHTHKRSLCLITAKIVTAERLLYPIYRANVDLFYIHFSEFRLQDCELITKNLSTNVSRATPFLDSWILSSVHEWFFYHSPQRDLGR